MREWVCLNGRLMPADDARISVYDSGFMQGVGLFETMRAYGGRVFRLEAHLQRLIRSANVLGWMTPPAIEPLADAVQTVLGAIEQSDARVRLTVTTGTLRVTERETPELTIVASATPGQVYPPEGYARGVTVVVSSFRQNRFDATVGHKTTSYFSRLAALREAHGHGASEALWLTHDELLAEGSISNVFAVRDGVLLTPPLDTPVLPGITRAAVLQLAAALEIPVREEEIEGDEIVGLDELFLTNSMMEILPVVRIAREAIGSEKPGEITQTLHEAYRRLVQQECGADAEA